MALSACSAVQAGTMGAVSTQPTYTPYIVGEASYTGANAGNTVVEGFQYAKSMQGWGGRLGVGIAYPSRFNNTSFTAEIGGGYYGSMQFNSPSVGGTVVDAINIKLDGYDVLVGALYNTSYNVDIFGEVGFMVQNYRFSRSTNLGLAHPSSGYFGTHHFTTSKTQALPEVKVGAIYNFTPNWGITVAYMGVFGSRPSESVSVTQPTATTTLSNISINELNPTLNSVMFGLRYSII